MKRFNIIKFLFYIIILLLLPSCNRVPYDTNITETNTLNSNDLYSQLQEASKQGNLEKVRALIKQGADVNMLVWDKKTGEDINDTYSAYKETPLMIASQNGHLQIVKELLLAGANVNQILPIYTERELLPGEDQTALKMSCRPDNMDIVELLASAGADVESILFCACRYGNKNLLNIALKHKPNLNFVYGEGGLSPLIMASENGHENIVKALLDAGADPNYTDPFIDSDYTAIDAAKNYPKIIKLLQQAVAKQ